MDEPDGQLDTARAEGLDILLVEGEGLGGSHVGDEAHGDFGDRAGGDNGLGACADEAARHAVDIERGPRPGAFENGVARFAGEVVEPTSVSR